MSESVVIYLLKGISIGKKVSYKLCFKNTSEMRKFIYSPLLLSLLSLLSLEVRKFLVLQFATKLFTCYK